MAEVKVTITGTSPLVLNNIRLADPADSYTKRIKELTNKGSGKRTLSEEETLEKEFLEWRGSLYENAEGKIALPGVHLYGGMLDAARRDRLGKSVERAVTVLSFDSVLNYDGPDDLDKLWDSGEFSWRTMINKNPKSGQRSMVPFTRPRFMTWSVEIIMSVDTSAFDQAQFETVVANAGKFSGVGNARKLGYGRFTAEVEWL